MNKKIVSLGIVPLLAITLVACTNDDSTSDNNKEVEKKVEEKVEQKEVKNAEETKVDKNKSSEISYEVLDKKELNKTVTVMNVSEEDMKNIEDWDTSLNGLYITPIEYETFKEATVKGETFKAKDGNIFVLVEYEVENTIKENIDLLTFNIGERNLVTLESNYKFKSIENDEYRLYAALQEQLDIKHTNSLNPLEKTTVDFRGCTFKFNKAEDDGGAIFDDAAVRIYDSDFSYNSAHYGGAITVSSDNVLKYVENTTFYANTADECGGACNINTNLDSEANSTFEFKECTFTGNHANNGHGGAIRLSSMMGYIECFCTYCCFDYNTINNKDPEKDSALSNCKKASGGSHFRNLETCTGEPEKQLYLCFHPDIF